MKPIQLNDIGETLLSYPKCNSREEDNQPSEEDEQQNLSSSCTGVHDMCGGWVDVKTISQTHKALVCRSCSLRFIIPKGTKTFGQLRSYCVATVKNHPDKVEMTSSDWADKGYRL